MTDAAPDQSRIFIVDDEEANVRLLERMLTRAGYAQVVGVTDPREALSRYLEVQPDLVLLDLHMPHPDGFEVMEQLTRLKTEHEFVPILVLTADITREGKQRALAAGAKDFLTKPFDQTEVLLRIRNLLDTRILHQQLQNYNRTLEQKVRQRTRQLEEAQIEILERLAAVGEYREDTTGQHTQRVGHAVALIAEALGLPDHQVQLIRRAAPLHDVGKIGISDQILLKPGKLTADEFEVMKTHTTIGAKMLSGSRFPLLQLAERIALTHHERWDGRGYPQGLRGAAIPVAGQIVAIADVFDGLIRERPYKRAWSVDEALAEIERQKGRQFSPRCVWAFLEIAPRLAERDAAAVT